MLIQVNWSDSRYDYVKDFMLESLIESGKVSRFLRRSGWVTVGVDPVRLSGEAAGYAGSERRAENRLRVAPRGGKLQ